MKAIALTALLALTSGCAGRTASVRTPPEQLEHGIVASAPRVETPQPTVRDLWQITLLSIGPLVSHGEFKTADSALALFAASYDGSCQAAEANFTRALLRLTPSNPAASPASALAMLNVYANSTCLPQSRSAEIAVMRKLAADMEALSQTKDSSAAAEIKKLKEQLELTRKELDRLRLRVIPPNRDTLRLTPREKAP